MRLRNLFFIPDVCEKGDGSTKIATRRALGEAGAASNAWEDAEATADDLACILMLAGARPALSLTRAGSRVLGEANFPGAEGATLRWARGWPARLRGRDSCRPSVADIGVTPVRPAGGRSCCTVKQLFLANRVLAN